MERNGRSGLRMWGRATGCVKVLGKQHDPAQARASMAAELEAARELADVTTMPTPEPVASGEPGMGYPLP